ncbi:monothiol glutaredoxin-S2-like [Olea europaea var. sylvestris]|uniref:monothiol glutaredoxin-S2-like n=1 Tax=Olea europaea var. sylvestris TaxID=158386 RepID=UPI000C1D6A46|nr:monothiol glutaredoxin-S2-like [Olea europaea var. sylvestris]
MERINAMVTQIPVVIFSKTSCCMCHTVKTLIRDLGVNPVVYELDEIPSGGEIELALSRVGCPTMPTVFIGGKCVGGESEVNSLHLTGALKQKLIEAGALWV